MLCIHGGLSPDLRTLDEIKMIDRRIEIPSSGPFCDLFWSDPEESIEDWNMNPRGAGWLFGDRVTMEVIKTHLPKIKRQALKKKFIAVYNN